eukprot:jgi/Botrbrau1/8552/Bobra.0359s0016.1
MIDPLTSQGGLQTSHKKSSVTVTSTFNPLNTDSKMVNGPRTHAERPSLRKVTSTPNLPVQLAHGNTKDKRRNSKRTQLKLELSKLPTLHRTHHLTKIAIPKTVPLCTVTSPVQTRRMQLPTVDAHGKASLPVCCRWSCM